LQIEQYLKNYTKKKWKSMGGVEKCQGHEVQSEKNKESALGAKQSVL